MLYGYITYFSLIWFVPRAAEKLWSLSCQFILPFPTGKIVCLCKKTASLWRQKLCCLKKKRKELTKTTCWGWKLLDLFIVLCVLAFILKRGMCFLIGKFCLNLVFPFILISSKFVTVRKNEMLVALIMQQ